MREKLHSLHSLHSLRSVLAGLFIVGAATPSFAEQNPVAVVETTAGTMEIELYADKAPKSVENFQSYANSGHYDGTIFHRVIAGFMVQGGGFTKDLARKPTREAIANEATNGLRNTKYTVAMARTRVVNSATSQFFVNVADNPHLDHRGKDPSTFGYAVFGRVIKGTDVVDKMGLVSVGSCSAELARDCPQTPIVILSVKLKTSTRQAKPAPVPSPTVTPPSPSTTTATPPEGR